MIPGIINVSGDFRDLDIGEAREGRHGLIETFSIDDELARYTVSYQTNHLFKILFHEVGSIEGRIHTTQSAAVLLVTVCAVLTIEDFTLNVILPEFRRLALAGGVHYHKECRSCQSVENMCALDQQYSLTFKLVSKQVREAIGCCATGHHPESGTRYQSDILFSFFALQYLNVVDQLIDLVLLRPIILPADAAMLVNQ